jgi:hypothetical protein
LYTAAALRAGAGSSVIHQNAPHYLRHYGKEMNTVGELHFQTAKYFQIRFVHQRSWLQRVAGPLAPNMNAGDTVRFRIHKVNQTLAGGLFA